MTLLLLSWLSAGEEVDGGMGDRLILA